MDPDLLQTLMDPVMLAKFQELTAKLAKMNPYEQAIALQQFTSENFTPNQLAEMNAMAMRIPVNQREIIVDQTNRLLYVGKPSAHFHIDENGRNAEFEAYTLAQSSESDEPIFVAFADVPDKDFIAEVDTFLGKQEMVVWSELQEMQAYSELHQRIIG
ncbi:MAG: hypothetical protein LBV19_04290 [Streptococcaceae bacterium]|jgi:hypothetical protein|nr:hypothetical protein [Streptococcaceae bacterium]